MRILLFVLGFSTFFSGHVFAQFDFESDFDLDRNYKCENRSILNYLDIPRFDENNIFELRVWIKNATNRPDLLRLTLANDSNWIAEKYDFKVKTKKPKFSYSRIEFGNWNSEIDTLMSLGLLSIGNWSQTIDSLKSNPEIINGDTISLRLIVADGTGYSIELLTAKRKRQYSYHCPKSYLNVYPDLTSLTDIVKILERLFKDFNYENEICSLVKNTTSNPTSPEMRGFWRSDKVLLSSFLFNGLTK